MRSWNNCKKHVAPFAAMAAVEFSIVAFSTLYKAAHAKGLNFFVFSAYSQIFGSLHPGADVYLHPRWSFQRIDRQPRTEDPAPSNNSYVCALVAVLYKGPIILSSEFAKVPYHSLGTSQANWAVGDFLLAIENLIISASHILQISLLAEPSDFLTIYEAQILIMYPAEVNVA
ncbi:WAT1-related protein [Parasponia andersonii]|uniref:WAT1-related protein n=1 Tax=Parasponia andersonii TaxID=3476 RepID=A0A2P5BF77_PARAD|nr:WAT1-related protein [Parasponia andersonii]